MPDLDKLSPFGRHVSPASTAMQTLIYLPMILSFEILNTCTLIVGVSTMWI